MTNETAQKKVNLLRSFFLNRTDRVAAFMPWGKPHPIEGDEHLDALLMAHVVGEAAPKAIARYTNRKKALKAISGHFRIGSYTPNPDGQTRWLCLDFDGGTKHADSLADPDETVRATHDACLSLVLPAYIEKSGGGHGWHLWVFFSEPVAAKDARRLGFAIAPTDCILVSGGTADARRACGIEVFPKQDKIKKKGGLGNLVWLPFWWAAPDGANEFYRVEGDEITPFTPACAQRAGKPESFDTVTPERLAEILPSLPEHPDRKHVRDTATDKMSAQPDPPYDPDDPVIRAFLNTVEKAEAEEDAAPSPWKLWREKAQTALPLESVYGPWLTGNKSGDHWFECRDPSSPSGDRDPSAGVADGDGDSPRGTFHSFRTGEHLSVFDFMLREGLATDFREAVRKVAEYSGVALPEKKKSSSAAQRLSRRLLPEIVINKRQFRDVTADAWSAVHAANNPPVLFNRMGEIVRVSEHLIKRKKVRRISTVGETALYGHLSNIADWVRETEEVVFSANPPKDVSRVMTALPHESLPTLLSLAEGPVFDSHGNLLRKPGYHAEEALWMDLPDGFDIGEIPSSPSATDIAWALSQLFDELLVDFPFVAQSDRAHAVAALVLPFVKRMIPGRTPIHLVESANAGSGKGLICHAVSILAVGEEMTATTLPVDDDEIRKKLTSELASGRPLIVLDNSDERKLLHSPSLASVITAETWTDRLLGQSRMLTVPNDAVWMMTGNNPRLSMEIARRCIRIRILSPHERPHLASGFKHDPFSEWAKEKRAILVRAVLVLVQAWIAADKPLSRHRLGSFERWAQTIGGILDVAGIPGFLGNLEELYEAADAEGEAWREFVAAWWDEHGEVPKKVGDLNDLCEGQNLLIAVRGDGTPRSQQSRLGRALLAKRDRVFGEKRIVRIGRNGKDKGVRYGLDEVDNRTPGGNNHPKQNNLFADGGTWRNIPSSNPQSSASVSPGNSRESGTWRNMAEHFPYPHGCEEDNSCGGARIIGTRAQEVKAHMGARGESTPMFRHPDLSARNHRGNDGGTSPVDVPPVIDLADLPEEVEE